MLTVRYFPVQFNVCTKINTRSRKVTKKNLSPESTEPNNILPLEEDLLQSASSDYTITSAIPLCILYM